MRSEQRLQNRQATGDGGWHHGKILISSLTVGAVALIATIVWYYLRQKETIESAAAREITAIAEVKVKQIADWRAQRLGDGYMLQLAAVQHMASDVLSGETIEARDRAELSSLLRGMEKQFLYDSAVLVDDSGRICLQIETATPSTPSRIAELGRTAIRSKAVALQDLYWDPNLHRSRMALLAPVQSLGAFVFTIDPERFLYPYLRAWPVPSASGETILVRREGNRFINLSGSRHAPELPLHSSRRIPDPYRRKPGKPVIVVAKIDASEVDAPVKRLGWEMVLIVIFLASANITAAGLIWRNEQMRVYQERESLLRQVADETPALLWTTSPDGGTMFFNKALAEFVGGSQKLKLPDGLRLYIHPEDMDRVWEHFLRCTENCAEFDDEHRLSRFDGEYRWVLVRGLPRKSGLAPCLQYSGSVLDITERKLAESEIQDLSARLISAQEEERSRLARELHDDLGQQIAALNFAVGNLKSELPSALPGPAPKASAFART